jgi:hypothetical protein
VIESQACIATKSTMDKRWHYSYCMTVTYHILLRKMINQILNS